MKQASTFYMRVVVSLIGLAVFVLGLLLFPTFFLVAKNVGIEVAELNSNLAFLGYSFLIGLYAMFFPFFFAVYQTMKILRYIDNNEAFSELSVHALKYIKNCAIAIVAIYTVGILPIFYLIAELGDAPGVMLIGMVIALCPTVVATLAAVLQRLLHEAIAIQSENDLTV